MQLSPPYFLLHKNEPFFWNEQLDETFHSIKTKIQIASFSHHPGMDEEFEVYCTASIDGIGAVLHES